MEEQIAHVRKIAFTLQCRHEGCLKVFQTISNRNKHERSHCRQVRDPDGISLPEPKRHRIETTYCSPIESVRDNRLFRNRAIGARAMCNLKKKILQQESSYNASKLNYAKSGDMAFGTVTYLIFKKRVANKMGHIIPDNLSSFGIEGSDEIAKTSFKAILLSFVFSYVEAAFHLYYSLL
jgi:hypothetical protein